jgi:hypothetical protein
MIIHAGHSIHVSHAVEREDSRLLRGALADSSPDDEYDDDTAEICRMIELSGMIGLECGLLGGE